MLKWNRPNYLNADFGMRKRGIRKIINHSSTLIDTKNQRAVEGFKGRRVKEGAVGLFNIPA